MQEPPAMIEVNCRLTRMHLFRYLIRRIWRHQVLWWMMAVIAMMAIWRGYRSGAQPLAILISAALTAAIFVVICCGLVSVLILGRILRMRPDSMLLEDKSIHLDATGYRCLGSADRTEIGWTRVRRIYQVGQVLVLELDRGSGMASLIPLTALPAGAIDQIRTWHERAQDALAAAAPLAR